MNSMILRNLSYGMYAIGVKGKERPSACIVNTVVQITSQHPPIIAVSMNHYNYSHQCIEEKRNFYSFCLVRRYFRYGNWYAGL